MARLDPADLVPLFELEMALESFCAGLAAERMTAAEIDRLDRLQAALEAARDDRDAYTRLNRQAHRLIVTAARSPPSPRPMAGPSPGWNGPATSPSRRTGG